MKHLPSTELLSTILGVRVLSIERVAINGDDTVLHYTKYGNRRDVKSRVNLYEFVHKCKARAWSDNISLKSYPWWLGTAKCVLDNCDTGDSRTFLAETEAEAIIKACEWIMKEPIDE